MAKSYDPYKGIRPKPSGGGGRSPQTGKTGQKSRRGGGPEDDSGELQVPGLETTIKDGDVKSTLDAIDAALSSNE